MNHQDQDKSLSQEKRTASVVRMNTMLSSNEIVRQISRICQEKPEQDDSVAEKLRNSRLLQMLDNYYRQRVHEDFPSIWKRWARTPRQQYCAKGHFAFIVGAPNSGTTILFRLLLEHPEIWGKFQESRMFVTCYTDKEIIYTLNSWHQQAQKEGKKYVLEKTPAHIERWPRIHTLVTNHKFLYLLRDGRDCVASCYATYKQPHEIMTQVWIDSILDYEELQGAFPNDVRLVHLRDIQRGPRSTLSDILQFLDVECSDDILSHILSYHERPKEFENQSIAPSKNSQGVDNLAAHNKLRCHQVNQPILSDTSRWQKEFPYEQYAKLHDMMQPWLAKYGYLDETNSG